MKTTTRDQKKDVYEAEDQFYRLMDDSPNFPTVQVWSSQIAVPTCELKFGDLKAVEVYLGKIFRSPWMKENYPGVKKPSVRHRRGTTEAHYEMGEIAVPSVQADGRWAMREMVILHEVAHHLTWHSEEYDRHGMDFSKTLLALTEQFIGHEGRFILQSLFINQGVK